MPGKYLTEQQYETCMKALGYTFDEELEHFFKGENTFLGNVGDNINDVSDLITFNDNGYPTYMAQVINNFISKGANLIIGDGSIDDYGIKHKKGLYCTNYRELYSRKTKVRSK